MKSGDRTEAITFKTIEFKGKPVFDIANSAEWIRVHKRFQTGPTNYTQVPAGLEHRPDLLSYYAYGTEEYYWVILVANNILDPEEELNIGDTIRLPII